MVRQLFIDRGGGEPPNDADILRVDDNLLSGRSHFQEVFGNITSLEEDLLIIAAAIFAADRATLRGPHEDICRQIQLTVPVVNFARLFPLTSLLERILYKLSNDGWTFELQQAEGPLERWAEQPQNDGRTLLFSGGLDSFSAAVEYGEDNSSLQLVSHRTHNTVTSKAQDNLLEILKNADYELPHISFLVSSRTGGPSNLIHDQENSQRTRSFLFLVLGALVARRRGHRQIIFLAENGQLAINLPLSVGRVGANSTHTAHPEVLLLVQKFLREALGISFAPLRG